MDILIFAVLLTIVQAAPPVPGKTANQPTRSGQNVKRNPSNQQNTPDAPIPSASEGDQHEGKPQGSHNARETVIIREPAPVSRKDGWDKAYVVATCLLVVVGGLAVKYAIKTLRAIEQQGRNMEKSVKIAESNAETAKDTVAAMHEANRNNLISLRTVQRPYIAPHLADMSEWIVTAFQKEAGLDHWLFQFPIKGQHACDCGIRPYECTHLHR